MPHTEIPKTSREVALQTLQECKTDSPKFIRGMMAQLEKDNPAYLDGSLRTAWFTSVISLHDHPEAAHLILAGNFFRYACSDLEMRKRNQKLPDLSSSYTRTKEEIARLAETVLSANSESGIVAKQMAIRIERDDPEIGTIIRTLVELQSDGFAPERGYAFIQGVHETHLNIGFLETNASVSKPPVAEPLPSTLPVVGRSIARAGLLEIILNSNEFIHKTLDETALFAPALVGKIKEAAQNVPDPDRYSLLSSFEIYCFLREFQLRNRPFPEILEPKQIRHPDPEIARITENHKRLVKLGLVPAGEDNRKLDELYATYNTSTLEEIKNTNPHLYWGIETLLDPLELMSPDQYFPARIGVVQQYSTIKTAAKS